jgi:hypothetical protein
MLYTSDTKAIDHIVANPNLYGKGPAAIRSLRDLLGNGEISSLLSHWISNFSVGILAVEGDPHKKQASIQLMSIIYALISVL